MSIERGFDAATSPERQEVSTVTFLGRLGDFGLGNPEGIPSRLAEATESDLALYGERLLENSKPVTDFEHDGCIDGRHTSGNRDGSSAEVRERHVSGSASNTEIAMNAQASVIDTLDENAPLPEVVKTIDAFVAKVSGKQRSAHTGGCGGANGAIVHNELIGSDPAVLRAAQAVMNLPEVAAATGVTYDDDDQLADAVRQQAPKTAAWLRENGWDGQTYVDKTATKEPRGVEELRISDDAYHGHAEDALVIDLRDGVVVDQDDVFVVSGSSIVKKATALAGQRGRAGYKQAVIADFAKHMAVAKVLPSTQTPVYLIS